MVITGKSILKIYEAGSLDVNGLILRRAKPVNVLTTKNLIVNTGLYLVGDILRNSGVQTSLTYHSIGTDDTTPLVTDTLLNNEVSRKQFVVRTRSLSIVTFSVFYLASESTYVIEECGVWGGAASATLDSGILFAHYLQNFDNSLGSFDLTFDYELTIDRG